MGGFRARVRRQIAGADSREIEAGKGGRGEVKERLNDDAGMDGTQVLALDLKGPGHAKGTAQGRSHRLTLKQPLLTFEARSGRGRKSSYHV